MEAIKAVFPDYGKLEDALSTARYNNWKVRNVRNRRVTFSSEGNSDASRTYFAQRLIGSGAVSVTLYTIPDRSFRSLGKQISDEEPF